MLTPFERIILAAISDFFITGGSALLGAVMAKDQWGWPTAVVWLVAGVTGLIGAFRHVQALTAETPR